MPFTPTHTFIAGTVIASKKVTENLQDMIQYVDGGIASGDLQTSEAWVDTKHLMRGLYNPIINQHAFLSGLAGGNVYTTGARKLTYLTNANSDKLSSDVATVNVQLSGATVTFELEQAAKVFFWFNGFPIMLNNGDGTHDNAWVEIYLDDTTRVASTRLYAREDFLGTSEARTNRHLWSSWDFQTLAAGTHSFTLRGSCESFRLAMIAWSVSVEAYYF